MSSYTTPNFLYNNSQDCITQIQDRIAAVFDTSTSTDFSISTGLTITNPSNSYYVKVAQGGLDTNNPLGITINPAPSYTTACNFTGNIDMNQNDITNVDNITNDVDINITASAGGGVYLVSDNLDVVCSAPNGGIALEASLVNINSQTTSSVIAPSGFYVGLTDYITGDGNVYASNFYGTATNTTNVAITDNNTSATYYPTFVSDNTGNLPLSVDKTTNPLSYIPSTGNLTSTLFTGALSGTATNATNCFTQFTSTSASYYPVFTSSNSTGYYSQNVGTMTYNPSTNSLTANTFNGNATKLNTTSDNSATTSYILFSQGTAGSGKTIYQDDTTTPLSYTPSTSTLTASIFSGLCDTGGLVYLSTGSQSITGSASATNISLTSIFNSTYKNYRIVLYPTTQVSFTAYPAYSLTAFSGTGTLPTTASLYGFEMISAASTIVSPVYTSGATISSAPLVLAVSQLVNHQTIIEIENVGFTATATQSIGLKCKSFYGNPGVSGASDRSILATNISGSTITGLTLQQSSISVSNNMSIGYTIYGYK